MNKKIRKNSPYIIIPLSIVAILWAIVFFMQGTPEKHRFTSPFLNVDGAWADSMISNMPLDQKIGQLIFYQINHNSFQDQLDVFQKDNPNKPGAVFLTTDSLSRYLRIVNQIQSHTSIPYLIGSNSESGVPKFVDIPEFSSSDVLYWLRNDSIVNHYIEYVLNLNDILSTDINLIIQNNYLNNDQIVNDSSNIEEILSYSKLLISRFQEKKILCGLNGYNYFPEIDSSDEFNIFSYPYKTLGNIGISAIKVDMNDSSLGSFNQKSFLSKNYNFNGLILNQIDSLNYSKENLANVMNSGIDAILTNYDYFKITKHLSELVLEGLISEKIIDEKVRKVLMAKAWTSFEESENHEYDNLLAKLEYEKGLLLDRQIKEESITIVKNDANLLPFTEIHRKSTFLFKLGKKDLETFDSYLNVYKSTPSAKFENADLSFQNSFKTKCQSYNTIILAISDLELDTTEINTIEWLVEKYSKENNLVLANFGREEILKELQFFPVIIHSHNSLKYTQQATAEIIYGGIPANGKLAFSICDTLNNGFGFETKATRFKYTIPEEVGISSKDLKVIDNIANEAIRRGATPGCQVFVAKEGKVIWNKSYGYHTYSKANKVDNSDLYDIASITKVVATTLEAMKMVDNKSISLNNTLSRFFRDEKIDYSNIKPDTIFSLDTLYFDEVSENAMKKILKERDTLNLNDSMFIAFDTLLVTTTPKNNIFKIPIRELLMHKSGLQPSMPIVKFLLFKNDTLDNFDEYYSHLYDKDSSSRKIANGVYLRNRYLDTLWNDTKRMKVFSRKRYNYSDANMVLLQMALDSLNRRKISSYMQSYFYNPLGLKTTCYQPLWRFNKYRIVPTEVDKYWRNQELRGYVHDPTAALLGGVAGNAGVFSNAHDIGVIFQMLLNKGSYGGRQFVSSSTVKLFTSKQPDHHRGLGFDIKSRKSIIAKSASNRTFGHTGFTGSCVWADPDEKLVFVFLSNRIHPSVKNWKLNSYKIRERIHEAIYEAIKKGKVKNQEKEDKPIA